MSYDNGVPALRNFLARATRYCIGCGRKFYSTCRGDHCTVLCKEPLTLEGRILRDRRLKMSVKR